MSRFRWLRERPSFQRNMATGATRDTEDTGTTGAIGATRGTGGHGGHQGKERQRGNIEQRAHRVYTVHRSHRGHRGHEGPQGTQGRDTGATGHRWHRGTVDRVATWQTCFAASDVTPVYNATSRVILSNQKSVFTQLAATLICCKTGLNVGAKTRNIRFAAMLQNKLHVFAALFTVPLGLLVICW